jgi:NADH-quinone oxidoreductase subunit E
MLPDELKRKLRAMIAGAESPREKAIDVMFEIQELQGWMSDQAMVEAAELLGMTPLELEELATFYDYIYRSPVGRYVIKVCDSTVCWLEGHLRLVDYLCSRLGISLGGTTADGLFTLLPVCCIGYCDRAPAMMVNKSVFGNLTPEKIDRILSQLAEKADFSGSE